MDHVNTAHRICTTGLRSFASSSGSFNVCPSPQIFFSPENLFLGVRKIETFVQGGDIYLPTSYEPNFRIVLGRELREFRVKITELARGLVFLAPTELYPGTNFYANLRGSVESVHKCS